MFGSSQELFEIAAQEAVTENGGMEEGDISATNRLKLLTDVLELCLALRGPVSTWYRPISSILVDSDRYFSRLCRHLSVDSRHQSIPVDISRYQSIL